ncbi:hypothetical protein [Nannocystis pusilla]|uniref:hypothetical protein n=1 Tax=Nannocystis pusilla TaxID=889268 RepID=UPI003DA424F2
MEFPLQADDELVVLEVGRHAPAVAAEGVEDGVVLEHQAAAHAGDPPGRQEGPGDRRDRVDGGGLGHELAAAAVEQVGVGVVIIVARADHGPAEQLLDDRDVAVELAQVGADDDGVGDDEVAVEVAGDRALGEDLRPAGLGAQADLEVGADGPAAEVDRRGGGLAGHCHQFAGVDRAVLVEVAPLELVLGRLAAAVETCPVEQADAAAEGVLAGAGGEAEAADGVGGAGRVGGVAGAGAVVERGAVHDREVVAERSDAAAHAHANVDGAGEERQRAERALHEHHLALAEAQLVAERGLREAGGDHQVGRPGGVGVAPDEAGACLADADERAAGGAAVELEVEGRPLPVAADPQAAAADHEAVLVERRAALLDLVLRQLAPLVLRLDVAGQAHAPLRHTGAGAEADVRRRDLGAADVADAHERGALPGFLLFDLLGGALLLDRVEAGLHGRQLLAQDGELGVGLRRGGGLRLDDWFIDRHCVDVGRDRRGRGRRRGCLTRGRRR